MHRTRRAFLRDLARLGGGLAGLGLLPGCASTPAPAGPARTYRVGLLSTFASTPLAELHTSFWERLAELGYVEGKNLVKEQRASDDSVVPFADLVAELVRLPVDVIVVAAGVALRAAIRATTSIPIVIMGPIGDPVEFGFVETWRAPAGT